MTLVVPFDGSELAEAALVRAAAFDAVFDEGVVAISVVPNGNADYAREAGWIGDGEFDLDAVTDRLEEQVAALVPEARYRYHVVGQYASAGTIAKHVREVAREENASMVVIGSENAGHLTVSISSVGGGIAADNAYDVLIVRNPSPSNVERVREASAEATTESGFDGWE